MKCITILVWILLPVSMIAQWSPGLKRMHAKEKTSVDSTGWEHTGIFILNVNQSSQSDWSGGGEKFMIGINAIINKSVHHRKGKYSFDAYADIELGVVEASSFKKFRKTTDRFDMTAELEHRIGKKTHFNYGILANVNTQLFGGHNYGMEGSPKITGFLSPGKILVAPGFDYKESKLNHYLSVYFSPATIRWITKMDHDFYRQYKFGVDSMHRVYTEIGAYLSVHFNKKISPTVNLIQRLDLFSNYKRKPGNIDILMNNLLTISIAKNFAGTFILDIIYDHDVKRRTQVQQVSGIGLRLKL